jgi:Tol biopolymer transport system component
VARRRLALALLLGACLAVAFALRRAGPAALPGDLRGTLVFVSDRDGNDALYARRLPDGPDLRLTRLGEPVGPPALSPDAARAAFSVGGRIAIVSLATGDVSYLSLGIDARDGEPSWRPDGQALVIVSHRTEGDAGDLWELGVRIAPGKAQAERRRLTQTPADEREPVFSPDARAIVYVRQDTLYRLDLEGGRARRLTGGLRRHRQPRFLPSGRLLCLWSEDKRFGIDSVDPASGASETLSEGAVFYSSVAPAPDGRYLVAAFAFDLRFRPLDALLRRGNQELRLLDAAGRELAPLSRAWRSSDRAAVWGR